MRRSAASPSRAYASSGAEGQTAPAHRRRRRKTPWYQKVFRYLIPSRKDSTVDKIRKVIFLVAVCTFTGSCIYLVNYYGQAESNRDLYNSVAELMNEGTSGKVKPSRGYPSEYQAKFAALWDQNPDIVGWLTIDGTQVNYPVVQTTDNEYYLKKDFTMADNKHGIPFADYRVDMKIPSTNIPIYNHNMKDGQMFGELINYQGLAFYQEHPVIEFNSVYKDGKYKIVGMFIAATKEEDSFGYHNFIDAENDAELIQFANDVKTRSLIVTPVDVQPGDELITLSTCTYEFSDARFAVVARRVRQGESASVDVSKAYVNPNPLMPNAYYVAKKQAMEALQGAVTAVSLEQGTSMELPLGERVTLRPMFEPVAATNKNVTWASSDSNIVTVDENGVAKAVGMGTASVTVTTEDGGFTATIQIKVTEKLVIPVEGLSLNHGILDIIVGDTTRLKAYFEPEEATNQNVTWSSSDQNVAVVDKDGYVTGVALGTATIRATTEDGGFTAVCKVTVVNTATAAQSVSLNKTTLDLTVGKAFQLTATITPETATNQNVSWSSSDTAVATVDSNGLVTGLFAGEAVITVKTEDGGHKAKCTVYVTEGGSISISPGSLTVAVGKTGTLTASLTGSVSEVEWLTSDKNIATVKNGIVTGVTPGTAVITAQTKDKLLKATAQVTVSAGGEILSLSIDQGSALSLAAGEEAALTVTVQAQGTPPSSELSWRSSDTSVASVTSAGHVKALKAGTAVVTVTSPNGKSASITITVTGGEVAPPTDPDSSDSSSESSQSSEGSGSSDKSSESSQSSESSGSSEGSSESSGGGSSSDIPPAP